FAFVQNFSSPHPDFFTEAWSLSIEEYAYLLLPLVLYISFYFFKKKTASLFLWMTLLIILVSLLLKIQFYIDTSITSYKDWSATFRKVVIYRLDAIYIGFLLVYVIREFPKFFKMHKMKFLA